MPKAPTLKTSGDLRQYLLELMPAVAAGEVDADVARNVTKMAAQITENWYAEIKAHALGLAPTTLAVGEFSLISQARTDQPTTRQQPTDA